jgi:hypothetical protein
VSSVWILIALQVVVGLGLLNVWLLRPKSATPYRGGAAPTLKDEFAAYGLPEAAFYLVGALKISAGAVLLLGLFLPLPVQLAGGVVAVLMIGAIAMHLKVGDPLNRSLPAAVMLLMSLGIVILS